jgi:hypothetical protein
MITDFLTTVVYEAGKILTQAITGSLLTEDQIRKISKNTIGTYFADFFPTPKEELEARARVDKALAHISEASRIVLELQDELQDQEGKLNQIILQIEEKKKIADHYATLAQTNQQVFDAFKLELEETLRGQLREEAERGKRIRQVISFIIGLITLILGAYLPTIVEFIRNYLQI